MGTKRKISETVFFDHNSEAVARAVARASGSVIETETQAKKALFTVAKPSPLIHLVVRVERLLLAELDKDQEAFYYKPKQWRALKDPVKAMQEQQQAFDQWAAASGGLAGRPLPVQVLGWGAAPLFTESCGLRSGGLVRLEPLLPARAVADEEALFEALAGLSSVERAAERATSAEKAGRKRGDPMGKSSGGSKRALSGWLHLTVQRVHDEESLPYRLDSAFHPLLPVDHRHRQQQMQLHCATVTASTTATAEKAYPADASQFIREAVSLEGQREAHTSYVNWLFLYPESVHLAKGGPSNPSLLIEVRLKEDDDASSGGGRSLLAVCGRSGSGRWHEVGQSSVQAHERKPRYWDELKILLPARLTPRHHLFFTFLHLHLGGHRKEPTTVLGHAVLPLFANNNRVLANGRHVLPLVWAKDLPQAYLSTAALRPRTGPLHGTSLSKTALALEQDKQHPAFALSTHVLSSVYPQEEPLCRFFDLVRFRPPCPEPGGENDDHPSPHHQARPATLGEDGDQHAAQERKNTIASWNFALDQSESDVLRGLGKLEPSSCMQYMLVLLNELFYLMASHDNSKLRREAFLALFHLVRSIEKGSGSRADQNGLLAAYARYVFRNPHRRTPYLVFEEVCSNWLHLLVHRHEALEGFAGNRFLLDILIKSMTLHVHSAGLLGALQLSPYPSSSPLRPPPCKDWVLVMVTTILLFVVVGKSGSRASHFSNSFCLSLAQLMRLLFSDQAVQSLDSLSHFPILIRKMFAIMDRGVVFNMVHLGLHSE